MKYTENIIVEIVRFSKLEVNKKHFSQIIKKSIQRASQCLLCCLKIAWLLAPIPALLRAPETHKIVLVITVVPIRSTQKDLF